MTSKEILLQQMEANFDEANWFVTVKEALKGLSEKQSKETDSSNHTIREIVNHLIFWNERYIDRFKGIEPKILDGKNSVSFSDECADTSDLNWDSLTSKLYEVLEEWKVLLTKADEEKLNSSPFKDRDDIWYLILSNINIHNSYHIGQIVTIRKQQGNWVNENDV